MLTATPFDRAPSPNESRLSLSSSDIEPGMAHMAGPRQPKTTPLSLNPVSQSEKLKTRFSLKIYAFLVQSRPVI